MEQGNWMDKQQVSQLATARSGGDPARAQADATTVRARTAPFGNAVGDQATAAATAWSVSTPTTTSIGASRGQAQAAAQAPVDETPPFATPVRARTAPFGNAVGDQATAKVGDAVIGETEARPRCKMPSCNMRIMRCL
jgi:hypothetical protein